MSRSPKSVSRSVSILILTLGVPTLSLTQTRPGDSSADAARRQAMVAAEDSRASTEASLAPLMQGLASSDPDIQLMAVRGVGRLERSQLVEAIVPLLGADTAELRAEAVNALGQSVQRVSDADAGGVVDVATTVLLRRFGVEPDPMVKGVVAETLGRLPYGEVASIQRIERVLAGELDFNTGGADRAIVLGVVNGLETLARLHAETSALSSETQARLRAIVGDRQSDDARTRRLALSALIATAGGVDAATIETALSDPDLQVRRLAAVALGRAGEIVGRARLIAAALDDPSAMVRYDALRAHGRHLQSDDCQPVAQRVDDPNMHVTLLALDLLGDGCPAGQSPAPLLAWVADSLDASESNDQTPMTLWHRPAHALTALARVAPDRAAGLLARFGEHPVWQVRMYAARAAAGVDSADWLRTLAADPHANVRQAAVRGLIDVAGHDADGVYIEALTSTDYQLIRTAAAALEDSPDRRSSPALLAALARLTEDGRDTSRDPRLAVLQRLRQLGARRNAGAVRPYLEDFDPRVAASAAETLTAWTGRAHVPATQRMRTGPPPPLEAVARSVSARVEMQGGTTFELQLFPMEAPATVYRFAQLARQGYYDGLTFHRVVPNFVIQGGSPGANEFAGDGPYMRDELGLRPHHRGAVGISTRGRDTGDAQIFVDLVDNPRLDHQFTVFAQVSRGMDVVDEIVEGAVIEQIEILER